MNEEHHLRQQDHNLCEALRLDEAERQRMSADLNDRLMERLHQEEQRPRRIAWPWVAAACLLVLIGIGTTLPVKNDMRPVAKQEKKQTPPPTPPLEGRGKTTGRQPQDGNGTAPTATSTASQTTVPTSPASHIVASTSSASQAPAPVPLAPQMDEHLHYAAYEAVEAADTAYLPPSRMDDFITKFASHCNVPPAALKCSLQADSTVVSSVYVFPDQKDIDVFGRLLQAAVTYGDDTPGYLLNFSHQQFFFQLKDLHLQQQYLWIAERLNGKILLYSTHSPIGAAMSSACYQEYRNQIMHTTITTAL